MRKNIVAFQGFFLQWVEKERERENDERGI